MTPLEERESSEQGTNVEGMYDTVGREGGKMEGTHSTEGGRQDVGVGGEGGVPKEGAGNMWRGVAISFPFPLH